MLWCTRNRLLVPDSMLEVIFSELPGDVFSTIIGSKSLQRISRLYPPWHRIYENTGIRDFFYATGMPMSFMKHRQ